MAQGAGASHTAQSAVKWLIAERCSTHFGQVWAACSAGPLNRNYGIHSCPCLPDKRCKPFSHKFHPGPRYHRTMSTHYETLPRADAYREAFAVQPLEPAIERHLWPRKPGCFVVHAATAAALGAPLRVAGDDDADGGDVSPAGEGSRADRRVLVPAQWGLVPHWVKSASDARLRAPKLVTAKAELAATATAFREAWANGQRCIVPMAAFYADDFRPGRAVPTRIARVDGKPMGVAGLWARWQGAGGEAILSYALLTVNASAHALLNRYGPPGSEKNMLAILNEGAYDAWLTAPVEKAAQFLRQYPATALTANPVENKAGKVPRKGFLD